MHYWLGIVIIMVSTMASAHPQVFVHFVFATSMPAAQKYNNVQQMHKELAILNRYFVTQDHQPIFDFVFKRFIDYESFQKMNCQLLTVLEQHQDIQHPAVTEAFNACFQAQANEIYFFIYDAYSKKQKLKSTTSWGFNNRSHPFILIDWERLNYNIQAAEPHEMGHAFGLRHVCEAGTTPKDATNIMASAGNGCKGSGGKRNKGFNDEQLKTILDHYQKLSRK